MSRMVIVPNTLRDEINSKLAAAIALKPDAAKDREALYSWLLGFFDEHGYVPEFSLEEK